MKLPGGIILVSLSDVLWTLPHIFDGTFEENK